MWTPFYSASQSGDSQTHKTSRPIKDCTSAPLTPSIESLQLSTRKLNERLDQLDQIMGLFLETIQVQTEETVGFLSEQMTTLNNNPSVSKDILHMLTINFNTEKRVSKLLVQLENTRRPSGAASAATNRPSTSSTNDSTRTLQQSAGQMAPPQSGYNSDADVTFAASENTPRATASSEAPQTSGSLDSQRSLVQVSTPHTKTAASMKPKRTSKSVLEPAQHNPKPSETLMPPVVLFPQRLGHNSDTQRPHGISAPGTQDTSNNSADKAVAGSANRPRSVQHHENLNSPSASQQRKTLETQPHDSTATADRSDFSDSDDEIEIKSEDPVANRNRQRDDLDAPNNNSPLHERNGLRPHTNLPSQYPSQNSTYGTPQGGTPQGGALQGGLRKNNHNSAATQPPNPGAVDFDSESDLSSLSDEDSADLALEVDLTSEFSTNHEESTGPSGDGEEPGPTNGNEKRNGASNLTDSAAREPANQYQPDSGQNSETKPIEVEDDVESTPRLKLLVSKKPNAHSTISPYDDFVRYYRLLPQSYLESHQKVTKPPSDGVTRYENGNVVLFQKLSVSTLRALCLVNKNPGKISPFENDPKQETLMRFIDELIKFRTVLQEYVTEQSQKARARLQNSTTLGSFTSANVDHRSSVIPLLKCININNLSVENIDIDLLIKGLFRSTKGPTWSTDYCICNRVVGYCTSICPCVMSGKGCLYLCEQIDQANDYCSLRRQTNKRKKVQ